MSKGAKLQRHLGVQAGLAPPAGLNGLGTSFPRMG